MAGLLDRRLHAYRPDLADAALRGRVNATRFAHGVDRIVVHAKAPLRREPADSSPLETEALFGESVCVFEEVDGWAWGQMQTDGYVGYLPLAALGVPDPISGPEPATHAVSAPATFLYARPEIKSPPMMQLPLNAELRVVQSDGDFVQIAGGGFVFARHVRAIGAFATDYVTVAQGFVGTPYLWGGRTRMGIDCSGLMQAALYAAGLPCPRDSDMQEDGVGDAIAIDDELSGVRRGDLIFWNGHVGMLLDEATLLHANAYHMTTIIEPLGEAVARIKQGSGPPTAVRRP